MSTHSVRNHPLPLCGLRASLFKCQLSPDCSGCVSVYLLSGCLEQLPRSEGLLTARRGVMFNCSFFSSMLRSLSAQGHHNWFGRSDLALGHTSASVGLYSLCLKTKVEFLEKIVFSEKISHNWGLLMTWPRIAKRDFIMISPFLVLFTTMSFKCLTQSYNGLTARLQKKSPAEFHKQSCESTQSTVLFQAVLDC